MSGPVERFYGRGRKKRAEAVARRITDLSSEVGKRIDCDTGFSKTLKYPSDTVYAEPFAQLEEPTYPSSLDRR